MTEEPETQENEDIVIQEESVPEAKTKLQQFIDRLAQYPDKETAKTHIVEIAKDLDCAKSLGYKALKRVEKFMPAGMEAREPTVKIPAPREGEIVIEEEAAPAETVTAEGKETIEQPALEPSSVVEKITPIFERAVGRLFNRGLELASGTKETLTDQEAKDTALLLPIMIYRFTKIQLNEDQMIDATCVTHFGAIALRVVNTKLQERRERKKHEPIVEAPPAPPKEEPKPEPKPETPHEPTDAELEAMKRNQKEPSFMKHLA